MKYLFLGILVKILAGLDNNIAHIPLITHITKTKKGKISLIIGIFISVVLAIALSFFFAKALISFPYSNKVSALLVLFISVMVYFELFNKIIKPIDRKISGKNRGNKKFG